MFESSNRTTVLDDVLGWGFSSPLAGRIRRKNGSLAAIAQGGEEVPSFGITCECWSRQWAKRRVSGWSMNAIVQWFGRRATQDRNPKDKWDVGAANWWVMYQP
jgi:hypothetical protein